MKLIERNRNLSYRVTEELGQAIVNGDFSPDDALPTEADLCRKFGVSRTAIREAVKMLSAKGLVSSKPRRGIRILPTENWNIFDADLLTWSLRGEPSRQVMTEFFQLRIAVEPEAAVLAARFASPDDLDAIRTAIDGMRTAPCGSDEGFAADLDFHVGILYATHNRFFIRLRDFINTALNIAIHFTTPAVESYDDAVTAHEKILVAIQRHDVEDARNRMRTLIKDAYAVFESHPHLSL
jgi:DNA-binding FadR family transcriptional regulator